MDKDTKVIVEKVWKVSCNRCGVIDGCKNKAEALIVARNHRQYERELDKASNEREHFLRSRGLLQVSQKE